MYHKRPHGQFLNVPLDSYKAVYTCNNLHVLLKFLYTAMHISALKQCFDFILHLIMCIIIGIYHHWSQASPWTVSPCPLGQSQICLYL